MKTFAQHVLPLAAAAGLIGAAWSGGVSAATAFDYRFDTGPLGAPVGSLIDSGPNGLNGTAVGLTYSNGAAGSLAGNFTGDFNYGLVADNAALHLQEFSLTAIVRPDGTLSGGTTASGDGATIVTKKNAEVGTFINSYTLLWGAGNGGTFAGQISFTPNGTGYSLSKGGFAAGSWYTVTLSLARNVSGPLDQLSLWVNGVLQDQVTADMPALVYTGSDLVIGAANYVSPTDFYRRNFNGDIDSVTLLTTPVPEPAAAPLMVLGLAGLAGLARRSSNRPRRSQSRA